MVTGPENAPRTFPVEETSTLRREHVARRVGWWVMSLVVVAALAGLFGHGVLGDATASDAGGVVTVDHERFVRYQGHTELEITVPAEAAVDGVVEIGLPQDWLSVHQLESVTPEPAETRTEAGRVVQEFTLTDGELVVRLEVRPERIGRQRTTLAIGDAEVPMSWFTYP